MSVTNNRTCVICCRSYHACKDCEDAAKIGNYRWRNSCDRPQCFQVLLVLTDFYYGHITKYEARERLVGILSDDMLPYDPQAKVLIDRIYEDTTPEINSSELQEDNVVEPRSIGEESIEYADEITIETIQEFIPNDGPETVVNEISECYEIDDEV